MGRASPGPAGAVLAAPGRAGRWGWAVGAVAAVALLALPCASLAAAPENADPSLAPWFQSLQRPDTGGSCCSLADCRVTQIRYSKDGVEALLRRQDEDGAEVSEWIPVPDSKILKRTDNPTGRAVLCWSPWTGVLCLVMPAET